ncbi:aminodeoxychorismate synthase component I [Ornithinimicrobium cerasi]|uniref:aminodeoxychorismate synthase component I n=1 Tax=Ornithinimicrobium cerasi TaxID=2248773 RepID=UPI00192A6881|nr:aminodeoxychorismate synthase component I [Ornithinimicrobium cerasi]
MTPPAPVLLVDNVDSFTYNVADLLHRVLGRPPVVWRNDHPATTEDLRAFAAIVVGPGPGRPQVAADMGLSDLALRQREVPVLGVCLGHQGLAHLAGADVVEMRVPRHGIVSPVEHDGTGIFEGVPSPLRVVRYHSLEVVREGGGSTGTALRVTARATDDGGVMALADPGAPRWGVQFHPESVLSEHGELIVANFLRLAGVEPSAAAEGEDDGTVAVGDALAPHAHPVAPHARPVSVQVCRLAGPVDDWHLREVLVGGSPSSVWLDASDGSGWSLVADGAGPLSSELEHRVGAQVPLLDRLDDELDRFRLVGEAPSTPFPWRPGFVGWLGYELKAETGGAGAHRSPWPDAWLVFADRGVVVDHATGDAWAVWLEDDEVAPTQRAWLEGVRRAVATSQPASPPAPRPRPPGPVPPGAPDGPGLPVAASLLTPRDTRTAYLEKVRACQDQIARGESYEICLTTTWEARGTGLGEEGLYRAMRESSPVPRGCWIRTPAVSVLGCSPERFVSVDAAGAVEARPIKGTRPRGSTAEEDAFLAADLAAAQKDRAENLMIVDLLRNDLHRVCRAGSVHVPEIFAVESYASVHQLVSTVRGRLATGMGPTDVLRACFPGGSMTGAPKVRTMEILDALEGTARGIYSGAVGWVGLDGSMDTSIVIRTLTWAGGDLTLGVGGAVTALSDPDGEYAETLTKARSVLRAVERAAADTAVS